MKSFLYAARGIVRAVRAGCNLRIQLAAAFYVVLFGFWQGLSATDWAVELVCCALVLSLEIVNTAVERLCDRVTRQSDLDIAAVKDMAAGAVLTAAVVSAVVWVVILCRGGYWPVLSGLLFGHLWPWAVLLVTAAAAAIWIISAGRKKR